MKSKYTGLEVRDYVPRNLFFLFIVVALFTVNCSTTFIGTIVKPVKSTTGNMFFHDENISISFFLYSKKINFILDNKTDSPIEVNWDAISLISVDGTSYRVIHKGIRLMEKGNPQAKTTIAPYARIHDVLAPSDLIYVNFWTSSWSKKDFIKSKHIGKTIGIYFPLKIRGEINNYNFRIIIDGEKK